MSNPIYIIRDWERCFENSESRKIKNLSWAPFPNRHDSAPFRRVAALKNSPEIFAAWVLIVQVASKMPIRGILKNSAGPLTAEDLSLMTGFPERIFDLAFEQLQKPGIQWILANLPASPDTLGDSPGIPGHVGAEGNRTEQKGTEQKEEVPEVSGPVNPSKVISKKKEFEEDSNEMKAAKYFWAHVKVWSPSAKEPSPANFQKWAKDFDLIMRVDNRTKEEIKDLINWMDVKKESSQGFAWRKVVLSPATLREKWNEGKFADFSKPITDDLPVTLYGLRMPDENGNYA